MNVPLARTHTPPLLQPGDRLTRAEFERRYEAMPHVKKAELIEGEVVMGSPVTHEFHGGPHLIASTWVGNYLTDTPDADGSDNSTVRLDTDNEPQPDLLMFVRPECGGRVTLDDHGYIIGSPELVMEVSASRVSIDLGRRLNVYRRNQVLEYIVWRVNDAAVDWFVFREGEFVRLTPDPSDGLFKCETFPGLWLDPAALAGRDRRGVQAALARGLASPEHAAFVTRLAAYRPPA